MNSLLLLFFAFLYSCSFSFQLDSSLHPSRIYHGPPPPTPSPTFVISFPSETTLETTSTPTPTLAYHAPPVAESTLFTTVSSPTQATLTTTLQSEL
ncbi:hypothetical protein HMI56_004331 [Coelomomyces lativittatus]|nr:hypothetical protein HMI56_004331 [Coelomomyces lativittatus]